MSSTLSTKSIAKKNLDMPHPKKLIEVALPLPEINDASAYDKMPGIGPHPKGIHHWWARLPLPTARAVLFASVVDDPSARPDQFPTEEAQKAERERLFDIVRELIQKRLHEHPEVYAKAREEMLKHTEGKLPPVLDPFAGGGSIPLEAARFGFEAHAADLNPVAVLLNKCNLELVPRWLDHSPVNPEVQKNVLRKDGWIGASGLAEDVRYYGNLVRERAIVKIGHLYPKVRIVQNKDGSWRHATEEEIQYRKRDVLEANVIAWLWARTVASPNPAAQGAHIPLIRSFWLSTKEKSGHSFVEPVIQKDTLSYEFKVKTCKPSGSFNPAKGTVNRSGGICLFTGTPVPFEYIRSEGKADRIGSRLLAIVAELPRGRTYVSPTSEHEAVATNACTVDYPDSDVPEKALGFRVQLYGMNKHYKMFTPRQLTAMVTLSNLVKDVHRDVLADARDIGLADNEAEDYARAVTTFLALALDRCADYNCNLSIWKPSGQQQIHLFTRQAIPMVWDFAEANLLGEKAICWHNAVQITVGALECIPVDKQNYGTANQKDAAGTWNDSRGLLVSTDPPYYDNIGYAALSDFFYIWLRRTIGDQYPDLFKTILVPKAPELIAAPERFNGDKEKAKEHFESGFRKTFTTLREKMDPRFPLTVYYAFKQEDEEAGTEDQESLSGNGVDRTTGWETLLDALLDSGFQITATWPVRASQEWRMRSRESNALASYIVLACRTRPANATQCTRRSFMNELKKQLPTALKNLQQGNIAPVDLAQAAIGPGMAIFSSFSKVVESSGKAMTVRTALALINQILDEVLAEQETEFDPESRWALAWFEQFGMNEGEFGVAETLSRAKNTAINGLVQAGIVKAQGGKVQLVRRNELPEDSYPSHKRLTVWGATQHLIHALDQLGELGAAELFHKIGGTTSDMAREFSYRLYKICEKKGWSSEALAYNSLVLAWPELTKLAQPSTGSGQQAIFE